MSIKLAGDATIKDVWPTLTHPRKYVAGVLADMRSCRDKFGDAHVRIGITGSGQKPYYRIFSIADNGETQIFGSFYDNRDPLENQYAETQNWSSKSLSLLELQAFLIEKTGFKGPPPK